MNVWGRGLTLSYSKIICSWCCLLIQAEMREAIVGSVTFFFFSIFFLSLKASCAPFFGIGCPRRQRYTIWQLKYACTAQTTGKNRPFGNGKLKKVRPLRLCWSDVAAGEQAASQTEQTCARRRLRVHDSPQRSAFSGARPVLLVIQRNFHFTAACVKRRQVQRPLRQSYFKHL